MAAAKQQMNADNPRAGEIVADISSKIQGVGGPCF
jgi:hypothetical protein